MPDSTLKIATGKQMAYGERNLKTDGRKMGKKMEMRTAQEQVPPLAREKTGRCGNPDWAERRNMERCAAFLVKMIEKYGEAVLAEIDAEEEQEQTADHKEEKVPD